MRIYLAGSVPKGDKEAKDFVDWRKEYTKEISEIIPKVELADPNIFYALEGDSKAVAGADCLHIKESDIMVVNAEEKMGAGTAMEIVVAKYFSKPVVTILPKDSHHRKTNIHFEGKLVEDWIHPFIDTFSDFVIEDIKQIKEVISKIESAKIKDITIIDEAIIYAQTIIK